MASISYINEHLLLEKLVSGDKIAFEKLYQRYHQPIYRKILRLTTNEDVAIELLQDTFIKLWEKRHLINPELSIKAWLYRVASNEVFMFYRKLARDKKLQEAVFASFIETYLHSDQLLENKESRELLNHAIDQLSPQRKEVFKYCKLEGKSYGETAELMGLSISTVSNHLVKATSIVRDYMLRTENSIPLILSAFYLIR